MLSALQFRNYKRRIFPGVFLATVWVAGLFFGTSAASLSGQYIHALMQQLSLEPLSIVGLLIQILFSTLVTVLAVILLKPELFYLAALIRAFFLSYFLECLILTGAEAAALLHWLFSPVGALSAMVLLYFWMRNIAEIRAYVTRDLVLCIVFLFAAGFAELVFCSIFL